MFESSPETPHKAFLIGTFSQEQSTEKASELLHELHELTDTLGLEVMGEQLVKIREPNPRLLLGEGKARELAETAKDAGATVIIFDDYLTPSQQRNWENMTGLAVIDRQEVILDIFAEHARTNEARLQIQLAQANYSLPRLKRKWVHFSRQGGMGGAGGHGAKGEGEQQIELDSRIIRMKIAKLKTQLSEVATRRSVQRAKRLRKPVPVAAIVGYTNAGKSSLLNAMTHAGVLSEDKLFATLDPTVRRLTLPGGQDILLADTVGFIRKLPTTLVEAFKSTLEETTLADYIVEIVDASSPSFEEHHQTTQDTLEQIGAGRKPTLLVFNKIDLLPDTLTRQRLLLRFPDALLVSASTGEGLEELEKRLAELASFSTDDYSLLIPHNRYDILARIREGCFIISENYLDIGVRLEVKAPKSMRPLLNNWEI
ncbi:MAG: GTPase HflX [Victivallales bacterium]|nr:GTPase HflX [Victivallales bacterium]